MMIGKTLSHFRILSKIGEGGMGVVYRAEDEKLRRPVALKVLPPELVGNEERRLRFLREARAAAAVSHPNIATIYEVGDADGVVFIAMELVEGKTLRERMHSRPMGLKEALRISTEIAEGLAQAHQAHVIHRDLKPDNVIIAASGHAKILDFGLAKLLQERGEEGGGEGSRLATISGEMTRAGKILGTAAYMSPEQARGQAVDARSDIFSFGTMLYEMVTGRAPFQGKTPTDVLTAIIRDEPPPASHRNADVPAELDRIIAECLEKDPEDRYLHTDQLAVDLRKLRRATDPGVQAVRPSTTPSRWRGVLVVAGLLVFGAAIFAGLRLGPGLVQRLRGAAVGAAAGHIQSLAVLPLVNLSGDPEQEYFADGMTEELITDLAKIGALRVISRTSIMHFKGTDKPLPEIARQLHVDAIIEGSVMKSGGRVRITAQLVEGASDRHVWAESYERDLKDVLALQDEVARAIAREIEVKLTPQEQARLANARTVNIEAYEAYMKGLYYCNNRDAEGFRKALESFKRALQIDPDYAPAYSGLADTYNLLAVYGFLPPKEANLEARAAASRALEIDDGLAEAHVALAPILSNYDWDWPGAEREWKRAIEINPGYATAHQYYSRLLLRLGRNDEALAEARRARELDPLSLIISVCVADSYWNSGRVDRAIEELREILEMYPNSYLAHEELGLIYVEKGMYAEGIEELHRTEALAGGDPSIKADLGHAYGVSGRTGEARRVLEDLEVMSKREHVSPINLALVSIALGDKERALKSLERAADNRDPSLTFLKIEHRFNPLRSEPRFRDLVRRLGLPPD